MVMKHRNVSAFLLIGGGMQTMLCFNANVVNSVRRNQISRICYLTGTNLR